MNEKECFKCLKVKPLSGFYKHPRMADGHLNKCKECTKLDVAANRRRNLDYYLEYDRRRYYEDPKRREAVFEYSRERKRNNPGRYKIYGKVHRAVRGGQLERPEHCEDCGEAADRLEAHHHDYSRPLDVKWLCPLCHGKRHRTVRISRSQLDARL